MPGPKQRLLTPVLILFMGTMVLANIAGAMSRPLLPLYLQELGANVGNVGLFFTLSSIAPLIFQIFGGWLSDSIGRLQAIAIGSLAGLSSYAVYIFAPTWGWVLLASIGSAMAVAFVAPSYQAFIAEQSTEETRGRVYGLTETIFGIVGVVGPLVGGYIAQGLSFTTMWIVAGCLYGSAAVIRVLMARTASRQDQQEGVARQKPTFAGLKSSLVAMFGMLVGGGVITWIFISDGVRDTTFGLTQQLTPLYLENLMGLSVVQISWLNSLSAVVAMLLMSPAGMLSDRHGERVGIVGGFGIICLGWVLFLTGSSFPQFVAAWMIIGAGQALVVPAYSSLISKAVPIHLRGMAFGLFSTSIGLISLPAPWIGAQLWEAFRPIVPFYIPFVAMLIMIPIMWVKFKLPPVPLEEVTEPETLPAA